jgi:hypothetical protein
MIQPVVGISFYLDVASEQMFHILPEQNLYDQCPQLMVYEWTGGLFLKKVLAYSVILPSDTPRSQRNGHKLIGSARGVVNVPVKNGVIASNSVLIFDSAYRPKTNS